VELASEAGVDYALLQTYIGIGGEVSSFSDGTRPKLLARDSRETSLRLAERRKMATICLPHRGSSPVRVEHGALFIHDQGKQSRCHRMRTILGLPKQAP
jgi:hypothetical protein